MKKVYPSIWFDNNGKESIEFYAEIFDDVKITSTSPVVCTFEMGKTPFLIINGGNQFKPNPAVSYFVYFGGNEEKLKSVYQKLCEEGKIIWKLDAYDWSSLYAWVEDRYGVSWQLEIDPINHPQKVVPNLLFTNTKMHKVREAMEFYVSLFPNSQKIMEYPYPENSGMEKGDLVFAQFKLNGFLFNGMSSAQPEKFDFSEANSFVIECDSQEEIDRFWEAFSDGGKESMCGWVQDRYGVWWQVVPTILSSLMADPEKAKRLSEAFMKIKKMDLQTLLDAAKG